MANFWIFSPSAARFSNFNKKRLRKTKLNKVFAYSSKRWLTSNPKTILAILTPSLNECSISNGLHAVKKISNRFFFVTVFGDELVLAHPKKNSPHVASKS